MSFTQTNARVWPRAALLQWAVLAGIAMLSLWWQGPDFNYGSTAYRSAGALTWYAQPGIAHDVLTQALARVIAPNSPLYALFALLTSEATLRPLFITLVLVTRLLSMAAVGSLARSLGLAAWPAIAVASLAAMAVMGFGFPVIGALPPSFVHTELALAAALYALAWMIGGSLPRAAIATAIVLDCNAMLGLWMLAPLALGCLHRLFAGQAPRLRPVMLSAMALVMFAGPGGLASVATQFAGPLDFDYRGYVATYVGNAFPSLR